MLISDISVVKYCIHPLDILTNLAYSLDFSMLKLQYE